MDYALRDARPGDGAALAQLHREIGAYYAELAPALYRRPEVDGLAADLDRELAELRDELCLVVEKAGDVVAVIWAALVNPSRDSARQIQSDAADTLLRIDYVMTSERHRSQGLAAELVEAAEAWGRQRGAAVAETSTYRCGPLSFPFWTERAGYEEREVTLRKRLAS